MLTVSNGIKLITLVVPTYNRAYALRQVLDTFYTQNRVTEIIFIDDAGSDETGSVVDQFSVKYPQVVTKYFRNDRNRGAAYGRKRGYQEAENDYVMYCDDDEFLGEGYAEVCLDKLLEYDADVVSGRHFFREVGESISDAIARFGDGLHEGQVFDPVGFHICTDVIHHGDIEVPFTHGIFLAHKKTLEKYSFDTFYSDGNGFREESDFQMNVFCNDGKIIVTNDVHCVHFNYAEVQSGGQRVGFWIGLYWSIRYTFYFLDKYYDRAGPRLGITYSLRRAKFLYTVKCLKQRFISPVKRTVKLFLFSQR